MVFQPIVPLQKREGISHVVEHDILLCHTNLMSLFITNHVDKKIFMCYLAFWQRNFESTNLNKICSLHID